jgi:diaminopimelate epimerase
MHAAFPFSKMHGLGNDFVVIDARDLPGHDWAALSRAMCDRHLGIGADQLLLVGRSQRADVSMRVFNTDGFEAEMCGNGIRCVGKYAYEHGIVRTPELSIETLGGVKKLRLLLKGGAVAGARVAIGVPRMIFERERIDIATGGQQPDCLELAAVDMGNPHAVAFSATPVADFPLQLVGPQVEHHALFPQRTNFEIACVESPRSMQVRVWERSAGLTLACGTGACAATVVARRRGLVEDRVTVNLPGGALSIEWDGTGEIVMTGPATHVFDGYWTL